MKADRRLGNSGNSDAPHLHFQLTGGNSPMGSEGIPYELEVFTQLGVLDDWCHQRFDRGSVSALTGNRSNFRAGMHLQAAALRSRSSNV